MDTKEAIVCSRVGAEPKQESVFFGKVRNLKVKGGRRLLLSVSNGQPTRGQTNQFGKSVVNLFKKKEQTEEDNQALVFWVFTRTVTKNVFSRFIFFSFP